MMEQGKHGGLPCASLAPHVQIGRRGLWRLGLGLAAALIAPATARATPAATASPGWQPWGDDAWWLPAAGDTPTPDNGGRVAPLLAVRDGPRLWLLGGGPSPAAGAAIAAALHATSGLRVSDLVVPWAHAAMALGAAAWIDAPVERRPRLWAHADVAAALDRQCPRCVARLRAQLGPAAGALGDDPVRRPQMLLHGASGRLGPLRWWRLWRAPAAPATLWALPGGRRWFAPGLAWGGELPELADTGVRELLAATRAVARRLPATGAALLGHQGAPVPAAALQGQRAYLESLANAVQQAQRRGAVETELVPAPPGASAAEAARHALNWQRAWREFEPLSLAAPAR